MDRGRATPVVLAQRGCVLPQCCTTSLLEHCMACHGSCTQLPVGYLMYSNSCVEPCLRNILLR